jgi:hypothetical protein
MRQVQCEVLKAAGAQTVAGQKRRKRRQLRAAELDLLEYDVVPEAGGNDLIDEIDPLIGDIDRDIRRQPAEGVGGVGKQRGEGRAGAGEGVRQIALKDLVVAVPIGLEQEIIPGGGGELDIGDMLELACEARGAVIERPGAGRRAGAGIERMHDEVRRGAVDRDPYLRVHDRGVGRRRSVGVMPVVAVS